MKVPTQAQLTHLQLQAMLRDHNIPDSELMYCGDREYTTEYEAHPEYHGQMMPFYLVAGEHEVSAAQIEDFDMVDDGES